ncbi:MAG: glycosyltransferase family 2 protein [Candidatus Thermochlorobacter sp.]
MRLFLETSRQSMRLNPCTAPRLSASPSSYFHAMPKASVILAAHNGAAFIADAVRSVFAQTEQDLELIVVDDASTDQTPELVQKLLQASPIPAAYLRNETNLERCLSRNRGASYANGKYLFFLDHDDLWTPDHIATMLNTFHCTQADMVCAILRSKVDATGKLIYTSRKVLPDDIGILVCSARIGGTPGVAFRKEKFLPYDDAFRFREDWELVLRAFLSGLTIALCDSDTVRVREHHKRSSTANPRYYHASLRMLESYRAKIPRYYQPFFDFEIGSSALRHGDIRLGWQLSLSALCHSPDLRQNPRNWLLLLKRGFRLDRWLSPSLRFP